MSKQPSKLIIIDLSNFIFRAFYAIRPLNTPDGTPVNAVHGVLSMLLKLLSDYQPTHLLIAKDSGRDTFRREIYPDYKANRSETPAELIPQFAIIDQLIAAMQIPVVARAKFEADDVIGSAVTQWKNEFDSILVATGDKDIMQFVDDKVKILDTMKGQILGVEEVIKKMGVRPSQIVDYLSIIGDSSDNIPGMKGIGPKGASKLLEEFTTLEKCIEMRATFHGKKLQDAFSLHLEDALLSKKLVEIVVNIDLGITPSMSQYNFSPTPQLYELLHSLGFKSMLAKIESIRPNPQAPAIAQNSFNLIVVDDTQKLNAFEQFLTGNTTFATHLSYDSTDLFTRKITTFTIAGEGSDVYFLSPANLSLNLDNYLSQLWPIPTKKIISANLKEDFKYLLAHNIDIQAKSFDITQAHYVIDPGKNHTPSSIIQELFQTDLEELGGHFGKQAYYALKAYPLLLSKLEQLQLSSIYFDVDTPMLLILAKMELAGVLLNGKFLRTLEEEFESKLSSIEKSISNQLQDGLNDINLKSPKQVSELLFEKLKLPIIRKTKTGNSTDTDVLQELAAMNLSEIPSLIISYREIDKLLSTYVKALPQLINPTSRRIHTIFSLSTAATGRLSSLHPNLQNIPVRTEEGRKIRKAFIATPGKLLLSADYSQIELRILAHMSGDPKMIQAFAHNEDIHRQTAAEILAIPLAAVTKEERSRAKAVNFGLMYGQSSFGLAQELGISRNDAKDYIIKYFERFAGVKTYLDSLREFCESHGHAQTLQGRKRFIPEIHSQNRNIKLFGERMAINSPIQGTAADLLKTAMIRIEAEMNRLHIKSKMLIQVHDELIFEVEESELGQMKQIVREKMENAATLKVPLKVDMKIGVN